MLDRIASKFNFFSGYILGFGAIWMLPRRYFDQLAMIVYDD